MNYSLRDSNINQFFFINDIIGIKKIKNIIDYRLLERFSHPIVRPKNDENVPDFFKQALEKTDIPSNEKIKEIFTDVEDTFISPEWREKIRETDETTYTSNNEGVSGIGAGEEAILCINKFDEAIFIPLTFSVMVRKGELFDDIYINEDLTEGKVEKELKNQEILLNKSGFFLSYRKIFFKFMMEHGNKVRFPKIPYKWIGYENLYNDSILWIKLIEHAIENYAKTYNEDIKSAEFAISEKIIESDITAKTIGTVMGWFKHYDEILLSSGIYRLYRTEHPFKFGDLQNIFKVLCDFIQSDELLLIDPGRIYAASLCIQDFRRKVFQSSKNDDASFISIKSKFNKEISQILINTETFIPLIIKRITLIKAVEPLKINPHYREYIASN